MTELLYNGRDALDDEGELVFIDDLADLSVAEADEVDPNDLLAEEDAEAARNEAEMAAKKAAQDAYIEDEAEKLVLHKGMSHEEAEKEVRLRLGLSINSDQTQPSA